MRTDGQDTGEAQDSALEETLRDFRLSIHAWSAAAYGQPRTVKQVTPHIHWRLATAWALGCVLAAGSVTGGVYEHHQRQQAARLAAARLVEQQRQAAEQQQHARLKDTDLLATVDNDVSRTVPAAMEPLAQLMDESETR
jgi:hypothetical protein